MQQKKKRKEEVNPWKDGTSSGHKTNLKQSILRLSISMEEGQEKHLKAFFTNIESFIVYVCSKFIEALKLFLVFDTIGK